MKKAYLVTFEITTRVVVDVEADPNINDDAWNEVVSEACDNLYNQSSRFGENVLEIREDEECPYGTFEGE